VQSAEKAIDDPACDDLEVAQGGQAGRVEEIGSRGKLHCGV
jgi:hypothetical protein